MEQLPKWRGLYAVNAGLPNHQNQAYWVDLDIESASMTRKKLSQIYMLIARIIVHVLGDPRKERRLRVKAPGKKR